MRTSLTLQYAHRTVNMNYSIASRLCEHDIPEGGCYPDNVTQVQCVTLSSMSTARDDDVKSVNSVSWTSETAWRMRSTFSDVECDVM